MDEEVSTSPLPPQNDADVVRRKTNRVRWLKLNFTVKAARLQTLKRQKYQHLQEEALLRARGLLKNWENGVVVLTEDLYRLAAGEREAAELMNYTPEALALRFSLRNNPYVLEAVRQLWKIDMPRDSMGCIDHRGYASVFRRIAKSLDAKAFRKKQKVDRLLSEDWKRDSKGEPTMSFANFFDSIFELADLWCETIDADDYVDFLERLCNRISSVRHGKRTLKAMKKVVSIDADSDNSEEEEESEEQDKSEEEEEESAQKQLVSAALPPTRILVAKAIQPSQQHPPANVIRNVSRIAISTNMTSRKVLKTPVDGKTREAKMISVTVPSTSATESAEPGITEIASDVVAPLTPHLGSLMSGSMSRQRRASVVTTIQFLDDGFVRSTPDGFTGGNMAAHTNSHVSTSMAQTAAQAHLFNQERVMRPSLASAAAAVLARRDDPTGPHEDNALHSIQRFQQPEAHPESNSSDRKRVITVSTAKYAVLKSVALATRRHTRENVADAPGSESLEDRRQSSPVPALANALSTTESKDIQSVQQQKLVEVEKKDKDRVPDASIPATNVIAAAKSVPIRIRSGSIFGLEVGFAYQKSNSSGPSNRTRLGLAAPGAATLGRNGLTSLQSSSQTSASVSLGGVGAKSGKNSVVMTTVHQNTGTAMANTTPGLDFSESVVMTSYAIDRPTANLVNYSSRPVTVFGPRGSIKKPISSPDKQTRMKKQGETRGNPVLSLHTTQMSTDPAAKVEVTSTNLAMMPTSNKPHDQSETELPTLDHARQHVRYALHAVSVNHSNGHAHALPTSPAPEGDPGKALRITPALEFEHQDLRSRDPNNHTSHQYERHYDFTDRQENVVSELIRSPEHGMTIQSLPGSKRRHRAGKALAMESIDPLGTPWDTFDDEDVDEVSRDSSVTARTLMQSENARETLARLISKRVASLSAGSSRGNATPTSALNSRQIAYSVEMDRPGQDNNCSVDRSKSTSSSLLNVASLGGRSVNGRNPYSMGRQTPLESQGYESTSDRLRESVSAPVLPTENQLYLYPSPEDTYVKHRSRGSHLHSVSPTKQLGPAAAQHLSSINDLHLVGETAVEPSTSPSRSSTTELLKSVPLRMCVCSRQHDHEGTDRNASSSNSWPPPIYRLDHAAVVSNPKRDASSDSRTCARCNLLTGSGGPTIIVNANREVFLEPQAKECEVLADVSHGTPTRLETMRRRHRHTRGRS